MNKLVVAVALVLTGAGCTSKREKAAEPARESGSEPGSQTGSGTAAASGSGSGTASGSGSAGSATPVAGAVACARYADCRVERIMMIVKDPSPGRRKMENERLPAYVQHCTESWAALAEADRTQLDTCVKGAKACDAVLACFAD